MAWHDTPRTSDAGYGGLVSGAYQKRRNGTGDTGAPPSRLSVERTRPLLGTHVAVRVAGLPEPEAHDAIDEAFAEIALIHSTMSFHETGSDVSRLNLAAYERPVQVHRHPFEVLRLARDVSEESDGSFDITIAPKLVAWGCLPTPASGKQPDRGSTWRDMVLSDGCQVRFRRPLWIDLGGIAKGYAVDCAVERLKARGVPEAVVNAGGDLRVHGPSVEKVALRFETGQPNGIPMLDISNGSLASSTSCPSRRQRLGGARGSHIDGRSRAPIVGNTFVSVVAERCAVADALTKVVLARGVRSHRQLRTYGATAHVHAFKRGWRTIGLEVQTGDLRRGWRAD